MVSTELDMTDGVDVEDVPSAAWGWSKENHKVIQIGGMLAAVFMLAMLQRQPCRSRRGHLPYRLRRADLVIVVRDWWLRRRGWKQ